MLKTAYLEKGDHGHGQFMSFKEYTVLRGSRLSDWRACYNRMLLDAGISHLRLTGVMKALTSQRRWINMRSGWFLCMVTHPKWRKVEVSDACTKYMRICYVVPSPRRISIFAFNDTKRTPTPSKHPP